MFQDTPEAQRTRAALERIAGVYEASAEQVALAWVAMLPSQPQVVIGTNRFERIQDAAGAAELALDREHWYELWEAAQGKRVP